MLGVKLCGWGMAEIKYTDAGIKKLERLDEIQVACVTLNGIVKMVIQLLVFYKNKYTKNILIQELSSLI